MLCVSKAYPLLLSDLEMFSGILAAAIHDYGHLGRSNVFLVNSGHLFARQHNDQHVMENRSLCVCLELMAAANFTQHMDKESRMQMRKTIISMVLATDMAEHFRVITQLSQKLPQAPLVEDVEIEIGEDQKTVILEAALKVADIGHTSLLLDEHVQWVKLLQKEFFAQGDEERENKMIISPLCNRKLKRNGPAFGENQIGFFDVVVEPLFKAFVDVFPDLSPLTDQIHVNYKFWQENTKKNSFELVIKE